MMVKESQQAIVTGKQVLKALLFHERKNPSFERGLNKMHLTLNSDHQDNSPHYIWQILVQPSDPT